MGRMRAARMMEMGMRDEDEDEDGDAGNGDGLKHRKVDTNERIDGVGASREAGHEIKQGTGRQGGPRKIRAMRARRLSTALGEKTQDE